MSKTRAMILPTRSLGDSDAHDSVVNTTGCTWAAAGVPARGDPRHATTALIPMPDLAVLLTLFQLVLKNHTQPAMESIALRHQPILSSRRGCVGGFDVLCRCDRACMTPDCAAGSVRRKDGSRTALSERQRTKEAALAP